MIKKGSFSQLVLFLLNWPLTFAGAVFATIINKIADVLPEALIGLAIHIVTQGKVPFFSRFGYGTVREQLILLGVLTAAIWIVESVFQYLYLRLWGVLSARVQHALRTYAYRHIQKLPMAFFGTVRVGRITALLNDEVNYIAHFLEGSQSEGFSGLIQLVTGTLAIGAIFFYISPHLALVTLCPIPLVILASIYFKGQIGRAYRSVREQAGSLASIISHNIGGILTIKSFMTGSHEGDRVEQSSVVYKDCLLGANTITAAFIPSVRLLVLTGFVYVLIKGGLMVLDGHIAVSSYGMLIFLTQRLIWPFTHLSDIIDSYEKSMASIDRISNLTSLPVDNVYSQQAVPGQRLAGEIAFSDVRFGYTPDKYVIDGLSLTIPENKTVAFVGGTGSGKSTIVKLLMRLFPFEHGTISVAGKDIRDISVTDLRASIGYVGQESFLIPDTLANNIRYGSADLSDEIVQKAAQGAQIDDFIQQLSHGYETLIDEHGHQLSGGQRQRLSVARALARDPQVLILDEATSALDNKTEAAFAKTLQALQHSRTIIMIAHRLLTVQHADIIFALDKGKIAEQGSHEELLARDGLYAKLWRSQVGATD